GLNEDEWPGSVPGGAGDLAAELGTSAGDPAPAALDPGHDPRVHHPDVGELALLPPARLALRARQSLTADDRAATEAESAVGIVLVPVVVRSREAVGRAARMEHQVAQADDLRVGLGAVVQKF